MNRRSLAVVTLSSIAGAPGTHGIAHAMLAPDAGQSARTSFRAWSTAAVAAAIVGWAVAWTSPAFSTTLMVLTVLWLASFKRPSIGLGTILVLYLVPLSHMTSGLGEGLPFDMRLLSVPFLLSFVIRQTARVVPPKMAMAVAAVPLIAGISLLWSVDPGSSLEGAGGLLLGGVTVVFVARALPYAQVTALVRWLCTVIVVLSVVLVPFGAEAVLGGRLRGVMGNPNALGAVIVIFLPLVAARFGWRSPAPWVVVSVVPFTGSRAATAAVLLEMAVWLWVSTDRTVRRTALPVLLAGVVVLAFLALNEVIFLSTDPTSVLRVADSRTVHWMYALRLAAEVPWLGYGFGAFPVEVASSYLLGVVELGSLSLFLFWAAVAVIVHALRRERAEIASLAAGGLCNAAFESWLFAGGSLLFIAFWTVMTAAATWRRRRTQLATQPLVP